MNQSELIEKVAQATELNQAVAGQAVKAVAHAILDALVAGEEVRVSGLGIFKIAARSAREGRNPQTERPSKSQPARQCGSTQARPSKMSSIRQLRRGRRLHHQRNPQCGSKRPFDEIVGIQSFTHLRQWRGRADSGCSPGVARETRPTYGCCGRLDIRNATVQHGTRDVGISYWSRRSLIPPGRPRSAPRYRARAPTVTADGNGKSMAVRRLRIQPSLLASAQIYHPDPAPYRCAVDAVRSAWSDA